MKAKNCWKYFLHRRLEILLTQEARDWKRLLTHAFGLLWSLVAVEFASDALRDTAL